MSLLQAITEIEGVITAAPISLTLHPDKEDKTLMGSGGEIDGHFLVLVGSDVTPWIDADNDSDLWKTSVRIEVATLEKASTGISLSRIVAAERARLIISGLLYTNLTTGQLWEPEIEIEEGDRYIVWAMTAKLRYSGATI